MSEKYIFIFNNLTYIYSIHIHTVLNKVLLIKNYFWYSFREEFSSKILDTNLKNKIKIKSMEMEIEKFDLRLKSNQEINQLEINDLYKKR